MIYEKGFKDAVSRWQKMDIYITQLINRRISPAVSVCVCVRVWKRGVGVGGEGELPAPRTNQITKL